ncbi:hypothetical protein SBV1_590034 [Verrucomicrobia bacterium]|nr:hypothetical protein SBV1_590034 [Verrucomicrobiota bacterium]
MIEDYFSTDCDGSKPGRRFFITGEVKPTKWLINSFGGGMSAGLEGMDCEGNREEITDSTRVRGRWHGQRRVAKSRRCWRCARCWTIRLLPGNPHTSNSYPRLPRFQSNQDSTSCGSSLNERPPIALKLRNRSATWPAMG